MGIFSSELFFVCIFFVRIFFRLFIFSFYIFSSVHFFVRIFFRPCIFSSTQFFVHADFVCHFSSMPFFVPAFFVFAIFRTCILSFVHFFDHAVLSMNFLIYVLGVCVSGPHRPRGVGYTWSVVRRGRAPLRSRPRQRVTVAGQQRVAAGDWPAGRLESVCAWAGGVFGRGILMETAVPRGRVCAPACVQPKLQCSLQS